LAEDRFSFFRSKFDKKYIQVLFMVDSYFMYFLQTAVSALRERIRQMKKIILAAMTFAFLGLCPVGDADEIQDLRTQMENQYKVMQEMQNKLIALENKQKLQDEQIQSVQNAGGSFKIPDTLKWAEKIKIYGDFRFRAEQLDAEENTEQQKGRARGIVRFRLGFLAEISDELTVDARLASGSGSEPTSTNFSLGEDWDKENFWLDRAYANWHPKCVEGLTVLAGKMGMPFVVVNDLIWDSDVNPEGAAVQYVWKFNDNTEGFLNGGGFWVDESGSDSGIAMWGIQGGVKHKLNKDQSLTGGVTYYDYTNIEGDEVMSYEGDFARGGNTVTTDGDDQFYTFDYNILEVFGEYGHSMFGLPSGLVGQFVSNTASGVTADRGWLIGYRWNKAQKAGTWQFIYDYRDMQRDAVLGAFTDADPFGGGIGGRSHRVGCLYKFKDNVSGGLYYWYAQRARSLSDDSGIGVSNKADDTMQRIRAEIVISF
jgi:hypothetical protein